MLQVRPVEAVQHPFDTQRELRQQQTNHLWKEENRDMISQVSTCVHDSTSALQRRFVHSSGLSIVEQAGCLPVINSKVSQRYPRMPQAATSAGPIKLSVMMKWIQVVREWIIWIVIELETRLTSQTKSILPTAKKTQSLENSAIAKDRRKKTRGQTNRRKVR